MNEQRAPLSDGTLRWGILATGGIARAFTRDLLHHSHRVSAVASRSQESADRFAAEHGLDRAHGSYDALLDDPQVDAVYVATPHPQHAANAVAALEHGKHVLVEKPFTINAAEAREVAAAAQRSQRLVMEAMWTRFLPHMGFVRAAISSGRIGAVLSVHAFHLQSLPTDPAHRLNDPALGGGALLDLGVYPVSFAHDVLGAPESLHADATLGPTGVDVSVGTLLRHRDGALSTSFSSSVTRGPNTAVVLGTAGRIEIGETWYMPAAVSVFDADGRVVDSFDDPVTGRGMQFQAAEVERVVAAGGLESPLMTVADSVAVMETLDRVRSEIGVRYPGE